MSARCWWAARGLPLLLAGCVSNDAALPVVTAVKRGNISISPLPLCNAAAIATVTLIGSGFYPTVDVTADEPAVVDPLVALLGPGGTQITPSVPKVVSSHEISFSLPGNPVATPLPPGPYDVLVSDPDGSSFIAKHALDLVPAPQVSAVQPASICRERNESVVVSGSGFTPGAPTVVSTTTFQGTFVATNVVATATSTAITVTIPAQSVPVLPAPPASSFIDLMIEDVAGCVVGVQLDVRQGCGP
jgi:hypothetical protein